MGIYSDKLCETVPVVKHVFRKKGEMIHSEFLIQQWRKEYYNIKYLKPVWEYLESTEGKISDKCYFLVTEEDIIGIKAAFAIWNYPLYEGGMADKESSNESSDERNYRSENREKKADKTVSYFSMKSEYATWLRGGDDIRCAYFSGLGEEDMNELELKVQCIMSCDSRMKFVQIKEEYLSRPWARELLRSKECEIIYLPKMNFEYYLDIMEMLISGERHKLDDALKEERLLQNIQKKCGSRFCEEDIAWSLDQAEKSAIARWDFRCLKAEDFKLDTYEYDSPMKKLIEMTGLYAMKTLAREWAALSREQMRNEKLTDICKHLVFVGKPGTGKTMCGKLLAQIMAEQGQSNGNFILASRKDIVAEFVGQTAPKVAGLFAKARKGVLFVDEAGFLLHDTKGSFNQEAIKEFVRYMEMYQDVTVIFALYPDEVNDWLRLDAGLSSRISRIIPFEDYSEQELLEIVRRMSEERGYYVSENTEEVIRLYLSKQRKRMGEEFGNAREGRKLVEAAVIARSIRCYDAEAFEKEPMLIAEDFEYGIKRLEQGTEKRNSLPIGFAGGY